MSLSRPLFMPPGFAERDPILYALTRKQWEVISRRGRGIPSESQPDVDVLNLRGGVGGLWGLTYNERANWGRDPKTGLIDPSRIDFYYQSTGPIGELMMELARRLCAVNGGEFGPTWATSAETGTRTNDYLQSALFPVVGGRGVSGSLIEMGHLSHGSEVSHSSRTVSWLHYNVDPTTGEMNYDIFERQLRKHSPHICYVDGTALVVAVNMKRVREIVDRVSAFLGRKIIVVLDIAHKWGLAVAKVGPFADDDYQMHWADFVVSTFQKTASGPNGGMIYAPNDSLLNPEGLTDRAGNRVLRTTEVVERAIFPGKSGKEAGDRLFAMAYHLGLMMKPAFTRRMQGILDRADLMRETLISAGIPVIGQDGPFHGGDCHLALLDVEALGWTGKDAASALEQAGITVNYNCLPGRKGQSPLNPPGLRTGSTAMVDLPVDVVCEIWSTAAKVLKREVSPADVVDSIGDMVEQHCPYSLDFGTDHVDDHTCDSTGAGAGGAAPAPAPEVGDDTRTDSSGAGAGEMGE